ncbi:MAG: hypothetical protein RIA63_04250, partial [Cyclobacteriaceae bacterium]
MKKLLLLLCVFLGHFLSAAQNDINWSADGNSYFKLEDNEVVQYELPTLKRSILINNSALIPKGEEGSLAIR